MYFCIYCILISAKTRYWGASYTGRITNLDFRWKVRSCIVEVVYPPCQYYSTAVTLRARGRQCWFGLTQEYSALHYSEHGRGPAHREGWSGGKWRYHHPPPSHNPPVKHEQRPGGRYWGASHPTPAPLVQHFSVFLSRMISQIKVRVKETSCKSCTCGVHHYPTSTFLSHPALCNISNP